MERADRGDKTLRLPKSLVDPFQIPAKRVRELVSELIAEEVGLARRTLETEPSAVDWLVDSR
jgi:hypothetical protein